MASRGKPPTPEGLRASFETSNEKLMKFLEYHLGSISEAHDVLDAHAEDIDALKDAVAEIQATVASQGTTINQLIGDSDIDRVATTNGKARSKKKAAKKKGSRKKAAAKKPLTTEETWTEETDDTPDPDEFGDIFGGDEDEDFVLIDWAREWLGEKSDKTAKAKHVIVKGVLKEHEVNSLVSVDDDEAVGFRDRVLALYEESE